MWNREAKENLAALDDERLMMLLRSAAQPERAEELFSEFFRRYHSRVSSWCSRITRNPERSLDLAQEVFLRAYRYRRTYRGNARVSTWLYAIARNHCLNSIRRLDSDPLGRSHSLSLELVDQSGDVHTGVERTQSFERLWRVIDRTLTALEKRVMALHYGHEITLDAITRELMLSNPSGAKAYLVNAKRKLKRVLGDAGKHCVRAA
jgi:RNA polymerase sigma-70 factor, ECF subfamily